MLHRIQSAVKLRLYLFLGLMHVGLAIALHAYSQIPAGAIPEKVDRLLLAGVGMLYGSFVLGALFVLVPMWPWIRRAQKLASWRHWILTEIPQFLVLVPVVVQAVRTLKALWNEVQAHPPKNAAEAGAVGHQLAELIRAAATAGQAAHENAPESVTDAALAAVASLNEHRARGSTSKRSTKKAA